VSCLVFLGVSYMVHIYQNNIKEDDSRGEYHSRTNWAPYDTKFDTAGVRMGHFLKE